VYLKSSDLLKAIEDSYSIYWGIILAIPANLDMSSITVIPKVENENRSQIQSKEAVAEIRIIDGDLFEGYVPKIVEIESGGLLNRLV
jgi:hypothetical protein